MSLNIYESWSKVETVKISDLTSLDRKMALYPFERYKKILPLLSVNFRDDYTLFNTYQNKRFFCVNISLK